MVDDEAKPHSIGIVRREIVFPIGCFIFYPITHRPNEFMHEQVLDARYYTLQGNELKLFNGVGVCIRIFNFDHILAFVPITNTVGPGVPTNVGN